VCVCVCACVCVEVGDCWRKSEEIGLKCKVSVGNRKEGKWRS